RRGTLGLIVGCPNGRQSACAGTISLEGSEYRTGVLLNGHSRGFVLRPRARRFDLTSGARGHVQFDLPRAAMRHVASSGYSQFKVRLSDPAPEGVRTKLYFVEVRRF